MSNRSFRRAHARRTARERRRLGTVGHKVLVAGATLGASAAFAGSAQAAGTTYTVTTLADTSCPVVEVPTNPPCLTLRDAIGLANADGAAGTTDDVINFESGLSGTIHLIQGPLPITTAPGLQIEGPGANQIAVSGTSTNVDSVVTRSQVFSISQSGSTVSISGLTIEDGFAAATTPPGGTTTTPTPGGAIANTGSDSLTLTNDTISGSTASGDGGGVYSSGPLTVSGSTVYYDTSSQGKGGAIAVENGQSLTLTGDTISYSTAAQDGGGVYSTGPVTVSGTTVTQDTSSQGRGGAIDVANGQSLTLTGDTISYSKAAQDGGGVYSSGPVTVSGTTVTQDTASQGGAIAVEGNHPLTLTGDTISYSKAPQGGGGLYTNGALTVSDSTITGNTATGSGSSIGGGIDARDNVFNSHQSTITNSTISNNSSGDGGGIADRYLTLSVTGSTISGNHATNPNSDANQGNGGGIYALEGALSVSGTTVSGNVASNTFSTGGNGGGIFANTKYGTTITASTIKGNSSTNGSAGGLDIQGNSSFGQTHNNPVSVDTSTISNNTALSGAGILIADNASGTPVTISASTISGNAPPAANDGANTFGGGILIQSARDPIDVINSTISGNSATYGGGVSVGSGGYTLNGSGGSISFDNSTISGNSAASHGGGLYLAEYNTDGGSQSATASVNSTIVAGNTAANQGEDLARGPDAKTGGFNAAYSLIQKTDPSLLLSPQSVILGVDPQLGSLANNGGPTETMLPATSSPVVDQGKAASGLTTDQRGFARTVDSGKTKPSGGDGTDIGSVELPAPPPPKPPTNPPSNPPSNPPPPISATLSPASGIRFYQAFLGGLINTRGAAVTWHFEYGKTTNYGQQSPSQRISAGGSQVAVGFEATGLSRGTRYHYRLIAVSSDGRTAGTGDATFKVSAPSLRLSPDTVLPAKRVRLFGNAGGCPTGDQVILVSTVFSHRHTFQNENALFTTVDPNGSFSIRTRIPKSRAAGSYVITGRCADSPWWWPRLGQRPDKAGGLRSAGDVAAPVIAIRIRRG